jgi:hypothetical protein
MLLKEIGAPYELVWVSKAPAEMAPIAGSSAHARFLQWMVFLSANMYEAVLRYFYADRYSAAGDSAAAQIKRPETQTSCRTAAAPARNTQGGEGPQRELGWLPQERHFIVGRRPTQDPIAARKASEAEDIRLVQPCMPCPAFIAKLLDQAHCQSLVYPILAVLKRQINEVSLRRRHGQIEPVCYDLLSQAARERIGGKGARCSPKHVARKLVHYDYRRKQCACARELSSITHCNAPVQFDVAPSYPLIKLTIAGKP